jgi:dTDP-4-dehydrorhamnose reductase
MVNKVLILGGKGMLGNMVVRVLSKQKKIVIKSTSSNKTPNYILFNIEKGIESLEKILKKDDSFDYIINCIGILNSSINENDPQSVHRAICINALFPHELAKLAQEIGVRVIQISTDGVFTKNAGVCLEDSPRNCDDVYGWTKALGEVISPNCLNLRCSIIGPSPYLQKGLLEWFLSQPKGLQVSGYTEQAWTGITTLQFANLCQLLINDNYFDVVRKEAPTHHFCPNQTLSKYELLQLFRSHFRPDIVVKPNNSHDNTVSRTLGTKYTTIKEIFGCNKPIQQAIKELAIEMKEIK